MADMSNTSDEQRDAGMEQWMKWKSANEDKIVDFGAPTKAVGDMDGNTHITTAGGYSILQAESLEAVKDACKDHPHQVWRDDAKIEFFELMDM